jgi:hypothetical protein
MDGHMGWIWLWWLFGIGLLVLLVWAVARAAGSSAPRQDEDSPEAIPEGRN